MAELKTKLSIFNASASENKCRKYEGFAVYQEKNRPDPSRHKLTPFWNGFRFIIFVFCALYQIQALCNIVFAVLDRPHRDGIQQSKSAWKKGARTSWNAYFRSEVIFSWSIICQTWESPWTLSFSVGPGCDSQFCLACGLHASGICKARQLTRPPVAALSFQDRGGCQ